MKSADIAKYSNSVSYEANNNVQKSPSDRIISRRYLVDGKYCACLYSAVCQYAVGEGFSVGF